MLKVTENVYVIDGGFVNAYLIEENGELTLIDTLLKRSGKQIIEQVKDARLDPKNIKKILITHSDGDHVGGINVIREMSGAKVYATQIEADAMKRGESSRKPKGMMKFVMSLLGRARKHPVPVDEIIEAGQTLPHLGGLKVVATPGHTPGHVSFYASEIGLLFAGDSMQTKENEIVPGTAPIITWDEEKALASIQDQAALKPNTVCVGHGPVVKEAAGKFPRTQH